MINEKIKLKGYVLEKKKFLKFEEFRINGSLKRGQVLVKILYTGLCGKQIEEYTSKMGRDRFLPHLFGHEASGIIIDKHKSVNNFKLEDHVVLHWMKNNSGIQSPTPSLKYKKNKKLNAGWITTFSNYSIISSNRLTKIPKNSNMKLAALLGCCLSTGIGTIFNQSKPDINDTCAVVGCGGVGLSTIIGLKFFGVKKIIAFDIKKKNLKISKSVGSNKSILINKKNMKPEHIKNIYVCSGNLKAIEFAQSISTDQTNLYFLGVPSPKTIIKVDANLVHKGQNYLSSSGGEIKPEDDINKYLKICNKNKKRINKLIIKTYDYTQLPYIIEKMSKGNISHGRNIFDFSECK
tara:strand:- start:1981 stop:3027 length:1047 start_codon:yes stop_codon:yes gene_type:complete